MSLPEKLQALRNQRNWSQEYVAKLMQINRSSISKYENGPITPSYDTILKFAEIYGVDKVTLLMALGESDTGNNGYLLKENPEDLDMEMVARLLHRAPGLKDVLLEAYTFDDKKMDYTQRHFKSFMRDLKTYR